MRMLIETEEWDTSTELEMLLGHEDCEVEGDVVEDGLEDDCQSRDFEDRILWNIRN